MKKKLREHLDYEFSMLEWASSQIDAGDDFRTQAVQNTILECFLNHAANLYLRLDDNSWTALGKSIFGEDTLRHARIFLWHLDARRTTEERPPTFQNHRYIVKELKKLYKR